MSNLLYVSLLNVVHGIFFLTTTLLNLCASLWSLVLKVSHGRGSPSSRHLRTRRESAPAIAGLGSWPRGSRGQAQRRPQARRAPACARYLDTPPGWRLPSHSPFTPLTLVLAIFGLHCGGLSFLFCEELSGSTLARASWAYLSADEAEAL